MTEERKLKTSEEVRAILEGRVRSKWKNHNCLRCGSNRWNAFGPFLLGTSKIEDGVLSLGSPEAIEVISLSCTNCGSTEILNVTDIRNGDVDG